MVFLVRLLSKSGLAKSVGYQGGSRLAELDIQIHSVAQIRLKPTLTKFSFRNDLRCALPQGGVNIRLAPELDVSNWQVQGFSHASCIPIYETRSLQ